jgi:lysophospholipase L1-like esterase
MVRLSSRTHLLPVLLLAATISLAQSKSPGTSAPDTPPQTSVATDAPLNPALPTVFIVGDSTARNQADLGWGDHFAQHFDTSRINVANRAVAGRSSRTFYNEGRWDHLLAELKPGDFVLIQMGHNDGGSNAEGVLKDTKGRSSIHSTGDETATLTLKTPYPSGPLAGQPTETIHTYGWYIRKYIAEARAKGATPILLTPTIRNIWTAAPDGRPTIEHDMGFRDLDLQLAVSQHVPLIDMASLEASRLEALGPEKTALLFPKDHTHTSPQGAELVADTVTEAIRESDSPLAQYLKPNH